MTGNVVFCHPFIKGMEIPVECSCCTAIKLLLHAMKAKVKVNCVRKKDQ